MNDTELNLIELQVRLKVFAEEFTFCAERVAADPKLAHIEKKYRTDAERCARFAEDIELFIIPRVQPQRNEKLPELGLYLLALTDRFNALAGQAHNGWLKMKFKRFAQVCDEGSKLIMAVENTTDELEPIDQLGCSFWFKLG